MILKDIDDKSPEIKTLNSLLKQSTSDKQKHLIQQDIVKLENGYQAEKENAYYLDFELGESENSMILHDIRIEHNGRSAQFDHIIVNRLGITILESKSTKGMMTINEDNSVAHKYSQRNFTLPNPIEQNNRHKQVLRSFLKEHYDFGSRIKLCGGFPIDAKVIIHPKTNVSNKILPKGFIRADAFVTHWIKETENLKFNKVFLSIATIVSESTIREVADLLIKHHTKHTFDYTQKYRISKTNIDKKATNNAIPKTPAVKNQAENPCPRCKQGKLIQKESTHKKYTNKHYLACDKYPKCRHTETLAD